MTMTTRQLTKKVSLDKPQILRPLPGPGTRDAEWEEWGRLLDRERPWDPALNWLDEHPVILCLAIAALACAFLVLTTVIVT